MGQNPIFKEFSLQIFSKTIKLFTHMKRLSLLFFILLFAFTFVNAQQTKVLVDEPTALSYYSIDQQIDRGFAPTSNAIQSIIFISFKVQNKYDYYDLKTT